MIKILVVRFRRIGDSVLTVPVCSSLKKSIPDCRIDFVLNKETACLYDHHPDIDNVIPFSYEENHSLFKYISKVYKLVRQEKYDIIIDLRSTPKTLLFSLFSLSTPYRIGSFKSYSCLVHNYRIKNHLDIFSDMVKHNLQLLKPLEKSYSINYCSDLSLYVPDDLRQNFRAYMELQGINFNKPVILAAVVTRIVQKAWGNDKMREILKKILDQYDAQIIFNFSAGAEEEAALDLHREMNNDSRIFTTVKANSLKELTALMANCNFFFGNEGGPRHIAQSFKIPSFAIFPPMVLKYVWLPNECDWNRGIGPCDIYPAEQLKKMSISEQFQLITVDRVWAELQPMLDKYLINTEAI